MGPCCLPIYSQSLLQVLLLTAASTFVKRLIIPDIDQVLLREPGKYSCLQCQEKTADDQEALSLPCALGSAFSGSPMCPQSHSPLPAPPGSPPPYETLNHATALML